MTYAFDFQAVRQSAGPLLNGLGGTLKLTAAANAIGPTFRFVVAPLVMSRWSALRLPAMLFGEFFRCTPAIVQIIWFFYCVPIIFDVFLNSMTMAILALGMNLAAFNAEAYRAAIQAVPREQLDAGIALGLTPFSASSMSCFPMPFALRFRCC